jgi:hypothetical protein
VHPAPPAHRAGALDSDHLGAHVGQHHRRERAGPDAGDLDDAEPGERPAHACTPAVRSARAV